MKVDKKILIPVGIAVIGIGIYFLTKPKNEEQVFEQVPLTTPNTGTTTPTVTIDKNKLLKRGVNGAESKELQKLLGVTVDGIFGVQTEAALVAKKGVTQTTLNQYPTLPNINPNPIAIGANVMANNRSGTPLFDAQLKADGTYFSNYEIESYVDYGNLVGTVKGMNATKTWYIVEVSGFFGSSMQFVKSSDIVKI